MNLTQSVELKRLKQSTSSTVLPSANDCTIKVWDVSGKAYEYLNTLGHRGGRILRYPEQPSWGAQDRTEPETAALKFICWLSSEQGERGFQLQSSSFDSHNFLGFECNMKPDWKINTECLRWGPNCDTGQLQLKCFQRWEQQTNSLSSEGQLCLLHVYISNTVNQLALLLQFLRVPYTRSFSDFPVDIYSQGEGDACNSSLHCTLDQIMCRGTPKDTVLEASIVRLPKRNQRTINIQFRTVEKAIYRWVFKKHVDALNK